MNTKSIIAFAALVLAGLVLAGPRPAHACSHNVARQDTDITASASTPGGTVLIGGAVQAGRSGAPCGVSFCCGSCHSAGHALANEAEVLQPLMFRSRPKAPRAVLSDGLDPDGIRRPPRV